MPGVQLVELERHTGREQTGAQTENGVRNELLVVTNPRGLVLGGESSPPGTLGQVAEDAGPPDEQPHDQGRDHHGDRHGVGVGAEPRNLGDAQLDEITAHAEKCTDDEDVGLLDRDQRHGNVLAPHLVGASGGVRGRRDAAGEGDVGSEDRAERHGAQEVTGAPGQQDAHPGHDHQAGEDESVERADRGGEEATAGGQEQGQ